MAKHIPSYNIINKIVLCFLCSFLVPPLPFSNAADPDPLQDFCVADLKSSININGFPCKNPADVTSGDFVYDAFTERPGEFNIFGGNITPVAVQNFPGLNTLGLSMNRIVLLPGGLNPPHVHPRASELAVLVTGKVLVGFISTANVYYWNIVTPGQLFVIPRGVVHFELNIGKENALFFPAFNSQNPGLQIVSTALFNSTPPIPDRVLSIAFQVNETIVRLIRSGLATPYVVLKSSY